MRLAGASAPARRRRRRRGQEVWLSCSCLSVPHRLGPDAADGAPGTELMEPARAEAEVPRGAQPGLRQGGSGLRQAAQPPGEGRAAVPAGLVGAEQGIGRAGSRACGRGGGSLGGRARGPGAGELSPGPASVLRAPVRREELGSESRRRGRGSPFGRRCGGVSATPSPEGSRRRSLETPRVGVLSWARGILFRESDC